MAPSSEPNRAELVQLVVLLALIAGFYFVVIPAGIQDPDGFRMDEGLPPSFSARLAAGLAALIIVLRLLRLTVTRFASGASSPPSTNSDADPDDVAASVASNVELNARSLVGVVLALVFSLGLIPVLGFLPASVVLLVALLWLLGERQPLSLAIYPLLVTLGVWLLFSFLLSVRLPDGMLLAWLSGSS